MLSEWYYNHIHTWRRFIYFLWLILWVNACIDLSKTSLLSFSRFYCCAKHSILFSLVLQVCIWIFISSWLKFLSAHVQVPHCRVCWYLKDASWWYYLWGLAKSLGHLVWFPWGGLLLLGLKVMHEDNVPVMVWLSVPECYLPQLLFFFTRGTSHIIVFLFLVPFIICCPFLKFWDFLLV